MAVTLNKFGVPIEGGRQGPMLTPKRKYLYRVRFLNLGSIGNQAQSITLQAQSLSLPTYTQEPIEVHAYNSRAYFGGKHAWNPIEVVARDEVTNGVIRDIDAQLQRQLDHFNQTGFRSATDYKFDTIIETMDGGNDAVLDRWDLEGSWFTDVNFGEMDWSASEFRTITMAIRYDNAIHFAEDGSTLMASPGADPQNSTL